MDSLAVAAAEGDLAEDKKSYRFLKNVILCIHKYL